MGGRRMKRGPLRHPQLRYNGKPLWKLLADLPNHGVGRLIIRGSFSQNEEEPSYMRIREVDYTQAAQEGHKSTKMRIPVIVDRIWRGVLYPRTVNITSTSHLHDFILVPENEEEKYIKNTKTAREKGYVYWNAQQKENIRNLIAQGMSVQEAKQMEKERIWREEDEAAARNDVTPYQQQSTSTGPSTAGDIYNNFDEENNYGRRNGDDDGNGHGQDYGDNDSDESYDPDYVPEEKGTKKKKKKKSAGINKRNGKKRKGNRNQPDLNYQETLHQLVNLIKSRAGHQSY
ncbi:uncharacterized protein [Eurosta solidaginis]|uniref:uncharacterized protein n=1 Tax=Eurosta solidaginis TaxID=178769 RepID=UPI0035314AB4